MATAGGIKEERVLQNFSKRQSRGGLFLFLILGSALANADTVESLKPGGNWFESPAFLKANENTAAFKPLDKKNK